MPYISPGIAQTNANQDPQLGLFSGLFGTMQGPQPAISRINPIMQQMLEQRLAQNPVSPAAVSSPMQDALHVDPRDQQMFEQRLVQQQPQYNAAPPQQSDQPVSDVSQVFNNGAVPASSVNTVDDVTSGLMQDEPANDHGMFSFMNKPGASDAMVAFGASMLKAPDFNTGLADGALAVNQVAREQRMPTKQEIAKALLKGRLLRAANGQSLKRFQQGQTYIGPDGVTTYNQIFDNNTGQMVYENANTGERLSAMPPGSIRIQNSGIGEDMKIDKKALEEARVNANVAYTQEQQFKALDKMIPTSGINQGIVADTKRQITKLLGRNVFEGYDPTDITTVEKTLSDFELGLAQTQKGLGQFTEMERMIVRQALPQLDSNPLAFKRILGVLTAKAHRSQEVYNSWMDMSPKERADYNNSFRQFSRDYKKEHDAEWDAEMAQAYGLQDNGSQSTPPGSPAASTSPDANAKADSYY